MNRIHATGHDIHVIVMGTAIVFRQSRATPQHPATLDAYWRYDFNGLTPIDQATYHRIKFGPHAASILQVCEREPPAVAHGHDASVAVCDFAHDRIRLFDAAGTLRSTITLQQTEWAHASIYAIALSEQHIWLALPTENTVLALDCTGRVAHAITTIFDYPESLTRINTTLYVCAMGQQRLYAINLLTLASTVVAQYTEPLWEYHKLADYHVVRLQSGIYHSTDLSDRTLSKPAG